MLILDPLPFATASSAVSFTAEHEDATSFIDGALYILLPLAIPFTIVPYIVELRKTYGLPAPPPEIPPPVGFSVERTLSQAQRDIVLHSPAMVWLVLSVVIVILTGAFWRFAEYQDTCNVLNPDVAGLGVRVSLWVPAATVMIIAALGHFHAEETGVKGITATLLAAQIIYALNLWTKELNTADELVGSMILDCLTLITPITFSMKECLAARQLIRIGYMIQLFSMGILVKVMISFDRVGSRQESNLSPDRCPCFQAYWWGSFDSCYGASPTFWLYFVSKAIAILHGAWLCFRHMDHYDAAEKASRGDDNTNINGMGETVYGSIPATAFTKHRECIAISISSMISIELALSGFDLPGSQDINRWGQTGQALVAVATLLCFTYGFYSMWNDKNVERRQKAIDRCSYGALAPVLKDHKCTTWSTWVRELRLVGRQHHPFGILQLRTSDHCRIQYETEAWKEIRHDYRRLKDKAPKELGAMLVKEAELGDPFAVNSLLKDGASVYETDDDGNTALIIASKNMHLAVAELLLQHGALTSAQNELQETALHVVAAAKNVNKDVISLRVGTSDITIRDRYGYTALHNAVEFEGFLTSDEGHKVIKLISEKTIDFGIRDKKGKTVFHCTVDAMIKAVGDYDLEITDEVIEVFALLLKKASNTALSIQDTDGNAALHYAIQHTGTWNSGWQKVIKLILERTIDFGIRNNKGMTVPYCAVHAVAKMREEDEVNDGLEVLKLVLDASDISAKDNGGRTALHLAAAGPGGVKNKDTVKFLLDTSDTPAKDNNGQTPLQLAMANGKCPSDVLKLLLEKASGLAIIDSRGRTLLHLYLCRRWAYNYDEQMVRLLLSTGDLSAKDVDGQTPLQLAMANGECPNHVLKLLLEKASDLAATDSRGRTLLHLFLSTASKYDEQVIRVLSRATDISAKDIPGLTSLDTLVVKRLGSDQKVLALELLLERFLFSQLLYGRG